MQNTARTHKLRMYVCQVCAILIVNTAEYNITCLTKKTTPSTATTAPSPFEGLFQNDSQVSKREIAIVIARSESIRLRSRLSYVFIYVLTFN